MATWQVEDAKTFNDVIERARTEGPQMITRHGVERAVVLSIEDYRALAAHKPILTPEPRDTVVTPAGELPAGLADFHEVDAKSAHPTGGGHGEDQGSRGPCTNSAPVDVGDEDFKEYLLGGPKIDDFSIERDRDSGRAVEL